MKIKFTLLHFCLLFAITLPAQSLTGIWRGHFVQSVFGIYEDRYKFEIQIKQEKDNSVNGVTYSYKTTVFYGKADLNGVFTKRTRNLIIKEEKLLEVKISDQSAPCLMTCYLQYAKMGNLETLTGTYASTQLNNGKECGGGKVYLEKVPTSDFYTEDFLKKSAPSARRPATPQGKTNNTKPADKNIKPGAEDNLITKKDNGKIAPMQGSKQPDLAPTPPEEKPKPQRPDVVKRRANELVRTIHTSAKEIKIELYDNGEIDGDTITVYHNNELVAYKKRLTDKPIVLTIKADEGNGEHEFVMVADNLGSIPPNTALMVITAGSKRYELFISSTEKKNAVVVIEYKPGSE